MDVRPFPGCRVTLSPKPAETAAVSDLLGVGLSPFNHVKELPMGHVTIHDSLVRTLVGSPYDQVFVHALAEVARGFGRIVGLLDSAEVGEASVASVIIDC